VLSVCVYMCVQATSCPGECLSMKFVFDMYNWFLFKFEGPIYKVFVSLSLLRTHTHAHTHTSINKSYLLP